VRVRAIYDSQARELREIKRGPLESRAIGTSTFEERFTDGRKLYGKTQSQEDRGSDMRDEKTEIPAGRLMRLSVAILVDERRRPDLVKLRDLASAVVGLVPQRGDTLSVQALAFAKPPSKRISPLLASLGLLATVLPTGILAVCALIAFKWSAKPLLQSIEEWQRRSAVRRASGMAAGFAPAQVRGALHGEPPHTAAAIISALPTATATAVLEMYPPEERAAIVRRMQRSVAPIVPDYQTIVRRA
jgi:flagellar biosynthesis/type III secretory pathway M-ring protein FliF/YscJ